MVAREAMPRTAPMARRRDGDIAPYRNETRAWRMRGDAAVSHRGRCGAAARWGHRALPQRDRMAMGVRGGRGEGGGRPSHAPRWRAGGASREGGEPPRAVAAKHRALPQRDCMAMGAGVVHASGVWQRGTREGRAGVVRGRRGRGVILFSGHRHLAIPEFLRRF